MASRRSRFKIAANIPVRRKATGNTETQPDIPAPPAKIGSSNDMNIENKVVNSTELIKVISVDNKSGPIVVGAAVEKSSKFKPVKKPLNIPIRRKIANANQINATESEGSVAKSPLDVVLKDPVLLPSFDVPPETAPSTSLSSVSPAILKSPSRGRFARPQVVDAASRRLSFHVSSASESEDDSRKIQNPPKARKVSENCNGVESLSGEISSPIKNNEDARSMECARLALLPKRKRPKVSNYVRKIAEARREFKKKFAKEKPERSKLTMFDLIFYNPGIKNSDDKPSNTLYINPEPKEKIAILNRMQEERLQEEQADDPQNNESDAEDEPAVPVPQVKIGANGEIILDEKSLVIETTEAKKGREALMNAVPVFEDKHRRLCSASRRRPKEWTPIETKCFYKALNSVGTDFAMMQALFPDRTRADLKNKFKREDRVNSQLIDIALSKPSAFNIEQLKKELDTERALVEQETKRQIEEKVRAEQRRKENVALRSEGKQGEHDCVAALRKFVEFDAVASTKELRIRRGPNRRKLFADFVNPFHISDDSLTVFKKPQAVATENVPNEEDGALDNVQSSAKSTVSQRGIHQNRAKKQAKTTKEVHPTVYFPVEEDSSDNDSITSSIAASERTEEIGNSEFIDIINRNLTNLKQTTLRFLGPSPSNENSAVRIVLDESDSISQSSLSNDEENMICPKTESVHGIESNLHMSDTSRLDKKPAQTCFADYEVVVDNVNVLSESGKCRRRQVFPTQHQLKVESRVKIEYDASPAIATNSYVENQTHEVEANDDSESTQLFEGNFTVESIESFEAEETRSDLENVFSDGNASTMLEADDGVQRRSAAGFQYTVIRSGTNSAAKKTYLAGLTPGTFVFMTTDTAAALENRCSMYMISETVSPDGVKSIVPMPVVLPPELMKLITDETK